MALHCIRHVLQWIHQSHTLSLFDQESATYYKQKNSTNKL